MRLFSLQFLRRASVVLDAVRDGRAQADEQERPNVRRVDPRSEYVPPTDDWKTIGLGCYRRIRHGGCE